MSRPPPGGQGRPKTEASLQIDFGHHFTSCCRPLVRKCITKNATLQIYKLYMTGPSSGLNRMFRL